MSVVRPGTVFTEEPNADYSQYIQESQIMLDDMRAQVNELTEQLTRVRALAAAICTRIGYMIEDIESTAQEYEAHRDTVHMNRCWVLYNELHELYGAWRRIDPNAIVDITDMRYWRAAPSE